MDDLFSCDVEEGVPVLSESVPYSMESEMESNGNQEQQQQYLMQVVPEEEHRPLFILVSEKPEMYYLEVDDGIDTWKGVYPLDDIKKVAREAKMSEEDVALETKRALIGENGLLLPGYVYSVVKHSTNGSLELTWKKEMSEHVRVTMGTVLLEACHDDELHSRIMDFAMHLIVEKSKDNKELEATVERLKEERAGALKRLEQCVNVKEQIEGDLYAKFTLVLNEKKAKIRRLMENAKKQEGTSGKQPASDQSHITSTTANDDSTDDEIFDDKDTTPSSKHKPTSTTSTTTTGTSLLNDDWQPDVATSPPTRRRKRSKNTTGGRVIEIPRPRSIPRSSRSSSRGRSEEPGSQDLINMM